MAYIFLHLACYGKRCEKDFLTKVGCTNLDLVFKYFDEEIVQYIDASDNVQLDYLGKAKLDSPDILKLYNKKWNENVDQDEAFLNALRLTNEIFELYIKDIISRVSAIDLIKEELKKQVGETLVLDRYIPYEDALKETNNTNIKYVVYPSLREGYEVRCVPNKAKFESKLRGLTQMQLKEKTQITDFIYCDNNGNLCITKTLESAKELIDYLGNNT